MHTLRTLHTNTAFGHRVKRWDMLLLIFHSSVRYLGKKKIIFHLPYSLKLWRRTKRKTRTSETSLKSTAQCPDLLCKCLVPTETLLLSFKVVDIDSGKNISPFFVLCYCFIRVTITPITWRKTHLFSSNKMEAGICYYVTELLVRKWNIYGTC